jgi:hypothetical protein
MHAVFLERITAVVAAAAAAAAAAAQVVDTDAVDNALCSQYLTMCSFALTGIPAGDRPATRTSNASLQERNNAKELSTAW